VRGFREERAPDRQTDELCHTLCRDSQAEERASLRLRDRGSYKYRVCRGPSGGDAVAQSEEHPSDVQVTPGAEDPGSNPGCGAAFCAFYSLF
jgi:hypothetical protein